MLFNAPSFLFGFLPLTLVVYYAAGATKISWLPTTAMIAASLIFYGWDNPFRLLPIILTSVVFNHLSSLLLLRRPSRLILVVAVGINLLALFYFKYLIFALHNIAALGLLAEIDDIALPIGISFYTFTQIAYLVDTFRGQVTDQSFLDYILFVSYFPHLVAGPILHHAEIMPQFAKRAASAFDVADFSKGLAWFAMGLFKKVVLADGIAGYVDAIFAAASHGAPPPAHEAWIGAAGYALQLYFDFSGYSDMAIGLALMMNIRFPTNFSSPYKADSLIAFWRRWHMTLSRFLRDYLYIPLGGNRKGVRRRHANLFVTMVLGGLWHGASWTFVLWGAIHGAGLVANHAFQTLAARCGAPMPRRLGQALTLVFVVLAWVPFRAPDLPTTWSLWTSMVDPRATGISTLAHPLAASVWLLGLGTIALLMPNTNEIFGAARPKARVRLRWSPSWPWALASGACFGVAAAMSFTHPSAFLYFRF